MNPDAFLVYFWRQQYYILKAMINEQIEKNDIINQISTLTKTTIIIQLHEQNTWKKGIEKRCSNEKYPNVDKGRK